MEKYSEKLNKSNFHWDFKKIKSFARKAYEVDIEIDKDKHKSKNISECQCNFHRI